jgi:hypothetical protein
MASDRYAHTTDRRTLRGILIALEFFIATTTIAGAVFVVPGLPLAWLEGSIFTDYLVPALALGAICGGSALIAAALTAWRPDVGGPASIIAGVAMAIFELVEIASLHAADPAQAGPAVLLQAFYLTLGLVVAGLGMLLTRPLRLARDRAGAVRARAQQRSALVRSYPNGDARSQRRW